MIFKDEDLVDQQLQIVPLQLVLFQNVAEHVDGGLGHAVHLNDGVALIAQQVDLVVDAVDLLLEVGFHLVIQRLDGGFLLGLFHDLPDALALRHLQLLGQVSQHRCQIVGRLLRFCHLIGLALQLLVEMLEHGGRAVRQLLHIVFQQLVQPVNANMVTGPALEAASVIRPAGIGGGKVAAAHGKERTAAVAALQKAGVHIVVDFHAAIVVPAALFPQGTGGGEGAVVDDGLMVIFNDDVLTLVPPDLLAVDLCAGVLALSESSDIEVVIQNALHGDDGPCVLGVPRSLLARRFFAQTLGHAGRGNAGVRQIVGDLLVAPAVVVVEVEDLPDGGRLGGNDFKLLPLGDKIAVGRGADPFAVRLPPLDDVAHLAGGVGDGHFVHKELKLDLQPIVIVGKVDAVADGNDAHTCVPQVLQLHQPAGIAAGEAGKVLDNENVVLVAHQPPAHLLIALPLVEGVAGTVTVFKKSQRAAGKVGFYIFFDDGLLVFDGDVLLLLLIVHGNAGIARNVKCFDQSGSPPFRYFAISRSNSEMYSASCFLRNSS